MVGPDDGDHDSGSLDESPFLVARHLLGIGAIFEPLPIPRNPRGSAHPLPLSCNRRSSGLIHM